MAVNKLEIQLTTSGFDELKKDSQTATSSLGNLEKQSDKNTKANEILSKSVGLLKGAFVALTAIMISSIPRFNQVVKQNNALAKSLDNSSKFTKDQTSEFKELSNTLKNYGLVSDEISTKLVTMGVNADLTKEQIVQFSEVALDTMAETGSNAIDVMKDLILTTKDGGSAISLLEQNFIAVSEAERVWANELTASGDTAEVVRFAIEKLNQAYKGSAQDISESERSIKEFMNTGNDLRTTLGGIATALQIPALDAFSDAMSGLNDLASSDSGISAISSTLAVVQVSFDNLKWIVIDTSKFVSELFLTVESLSSGLFELSKSSAVVSESFDFLAAVGKSAFDTLKAGMGQAAALLQGDLDKAIKIGNDSLKQNAKTWENVGDTSKNTLDDIQKALSTQKRENEAYYKSLRDNSRTTNNSIQSDVKKTGDTIDKMVGMSVVQLKKLDSSASIIGDTFSAMGNIINASLTKTFETSTKAFDDQINSLNDKEEERLNAQKEKDEEVDTSKLEMLEKEEERALASGDKLTASALEHAKKKEKALVDTANKEKALKAQELENVKKHEQAVAMVEYQRAVSEHTNEVQNAKSQVSMAQGEAVLGVGMATLNAAVGVSKSFGQGGLAGAVAGIAAAAGIIGSVASGATGVASASSSLESVQGQAPTPPQFAYGTNGYGLGIGESAIVGERGAEVVTNRGGNGIEVMSTDNTSRYNSENENPVIINIYAEFGADEIASKVQEVLQQYQPRIFNYV